MAMTVALVLLLALLSVSPGYSQITESNIRQYLYTEIEGALLRNPLTLLQLRDTLIKDDVPLTVGFTVMIMANNITNPSNCTPITKENTPAFIKIPVMGFWMLPAPLNNFWTPFIQPNSLAEDEDLLNFAASLYGTVTYWVVALTVVPQDEFPDMNVSTTAMMLNISSLSCNPGVVDMQFATCGVFSWIKAYAMYGGRPPSWDLNDQREVHLMDVAKDNFAIRTCGRVPSDKVRTTIIILGVGYVFFCFAAWIIVARLFPLYHSMAVRTIRSKAAISLYWGCGFVCVLLVLAPISVQIIGGATALFTKHVTIQRNIAIAFITRSVVYVISVVYFASTAMMLSRKTESVPIPARRFTTNVLFGFCLCFPLSSQRKARGVHIMVLASFMIVVFYVLMDTIPLFLLLLHNITIGVSYPLLFISGFFLIMMIIAHMFYLSITGKTPLNTAYTAVAHVIHAAGVVCGLGVVAVIIAGYRELFSVYNINTSSFGNFVIFLLPSLALFAGGLFIRKKLMKEDIENQPTIPVTNDDEYGVPDYGATGYTTNNGEKDGLLA